MGHHTMLGSIFNILRRQSHGMTRLRCNHFHTKHLCVSKLFPGSQSVIDSHSVPVEDVTCHSQKLMLLYRLLCPGASGTYSCLPLLTRSLEKLTRLIDREMQSIGAQKITMPCLAPGPLWKKSDRWDLMGAEMFKLKDRHGKDVGLSPTHEEAVTSIVAMETQVASQKLPIKLYQIGRKFRDEKRPKHGLLRSREFEMKDLYTFDATSELAEETYQEVCDAYSNLFKSLDLDVLKAEADNGTMGGSKSHEYHLQSSIGEDRLFVCPQCHKCVNAEVKDETVDMSCPASNCPGMLQEISAIEVAHAFILGTKFSDIFKATFTENKKHITYSMGCYGIGVTRLLAAAIEVLSVGDQVRWPSLLAPHQVCIISQQSGYYFEESLAMAESLQEELHSKPNLYNEVIVDDRHKFSIGKRIRLCDQLGFPYLVVLGKNVQKDPPLFELIDVKSGDKQLLTKEQIVEQLSQINTVII